MSNFSDFAGGGGGGTSLQAIATGTISNGSTVVINADGTVSVVSGIIQEISNAITFQSSVAVQVSATFDSLNNKIVIAYRNNSNSNFGTAVVGTVSGTSISFGTPVVFESGETTNISATFDSLNNKVVIAYRDNSNSNFGTAVVGTVSGTSISFGAPVVFESASPADISATFDNLNNKVVIAYRAIGNTEFGTAVVGTVSGTSISFGTPVVFQSSASVEIAVTFDTNNDKVVVAYSNSGNSNFGTAVVGTVSGTSISFGTPVLFANATSIRVSTTFDSLNNKVVIAYRDNSNSFFGTAVVGTVSGTSISFGTPVVFESASTENTFISFDNNLNKVVVTYRDVGNSNSGTVVVGTVSGTSISFGTPDVFDAQNPVEIASAFDELNDKIVIAYSEKNGVTNFGVARVLNVGDTNLTSDNFIGFSDAVYADAQVATIQLTGSVNEAQSGLTVAKKQFVQFDGTLSTTAGIIPVFAGIAVATDKIIVKG